MLLRSFYEATNLLHCDTTDWLSIISSFKFFYAVATRPSRQKFHKYHITSRTTLKSTNCNWKQQTEICFSKSISGHGVAPLHSQLVLPLLFQSCDVLLVFLHMLDHCHPSPFPFLRFSPTDVQPHGQKSNNKNGHIDRGKILRIANHRRNLLLNLARVPTLFTSEPDSLQPG